MDDVANEKIENVTATSTSSGDFMRILTTQMVVERIDAIAILYLILSFIALAGLLQFLGIYRERIRQFNSAVVRRILQLCTYCLEEKYFHLRPNEIMTRGHINLLELFVRTTIDFFYDAPNLITFIIGLLQVISTFDPDHPWNAKKINLIALCVNYLYTMVREISMYQTAYIFDESRNSRVYKLLSSDPSPTSEQLLRESLRPVLAKDLVVGDVIQLDYGETFPAECQVLRSAQTHTLINTKEESGEDCSWIFTKGDIVPYGSRVSIQSATVVAQVTATRNTISADGTHRRQERFPEHMNREITKANLFALGLLSIVGSVSVMYVLGDSQNEKFNQVIFTHFFSIIAQLNMLIPSMRWVILYFLYVFLIDSAYPSVTVQSHAAVRRLRDVDVVYTDKTGTLTDTRVDVESIDLLPGLDQLMNELAPVTSIERKTLAAIIIMACNDTQPGNGEGTSPEEMVIAEYMRSSMSVWIEKNPLKPSNETQKLTVDGRHVKITIRSRSSYIPSEFCRVAEIDGIVALTVRQGGSDRMAALTKNNAVVKAEGSAARANPNRAFGWTVTFGDKSFYCIRGTFRNPPRPSSEDLVRFLQSGERIAVRMLTGDGLEAAKYIASSVGIHHPESCPSVLRQEYERTADFIAAVNRNLQSQSGSVTVLIEGSELLRLISSDNHDCCFLKDPRINMVIYRTKSADKAVIVRHAAETLGLGAAMIGDAANDKHVLALASIVSVSLRHGAAPCRVVSDIVVTEPGDLVDLWTSIQALHLTGAKALLINTCLIGSVVSGLTWVGIFFSEFKLLPKGFLYADPYDTRMMLVFSSLLYAPSACAAVMGGFSVPRSSIKVYSLAVLIAGLLFGVVVGLIGPKNGYGRWMLVITILVGMTSHAMLSHAKFMRARDGKGDRIGALVDLLNRRSVRICIVLAYISLVLIA
jgi:cation transport ATPase